MRRMIKNKMEGAIGVGHLGVIRLYDVDDDDGDGRFSARKLLCSLLSYSSSSSYSAFPNSGSLFQIFFFHSFLFLVSPLLSPFSPADALILSPSSGPPALHLQAQRPPYNVTHLSPHPMSITN